MKRKKRKKRERFYQVVAKAIVEGAPFDISKNDGGWKKIQELVVLYMLRELDDASRYKIWNGFLRKVDGVFYAAIKFIDENPDNLLEFEDRYVYRRKPNGRRNNEFLSIKVGYRNAKERNTERLLRNMEKVIRPSIAEIAKKDPERLRIGQEKIRKLLTSK